MRNLSTIMLKPRPLWIGSQKHRRIKHVRYHSPARSLHYDPGIRTPATLRPTTKAGTSTCAIPNLGVSACKLMSRQAAGGHG